MHMITTHQNKRFGVALYSGLPPERLLGGEKYFEAEPVIKTKVKRSLQRSQYIFRGVPENFFWEVLKQTS